ncbi:PAS domain-containing sensor histidine kinase [Enterovirga sp.]|uniref:sensor histidine kinase n=1 Tax=Enterovirga sp. TaxID=2026350 RepID=UPI00262C47AF|nr:PAS domain-containing sensor histidine kinase [Enterovirga sp.]MDB5593022.1 sensor histidine kinase [Enterovirga sp.]
MDPTRGGWECIVAPLIEEAGVNRILEAGACVLVWSRDGERRLWPADAGGGAEPARAHPNWHRHVRTLAAGGLVPREGFRFDRWRETPLEAPLTVASRVITSPEGAEALLTIAVSRARAPRRFAARAAADSSGPATPVAVAAAPGTEAPLARRGVRFTWRADASGRMAEVSAALAASIGQPSGHLRSRQWSELAGSALRDEGGTVMARMAAGQGWSRVPLLLRHGDRVRAVPGEISGAPIFGPTGGVEGFRGYGTVFPDEAREVSPDLFLEVPAAAEASVEAGAMQPPVAAEPYGGLDQAMSVAAAMTGTARDGMFGMLRAFLAPPPGFPAGDGVAAPESEAALPDPQPALSADETGALQEIARALGSVGPGERPLSVGRGPAEIVPLPPRPRVPEASRILDRLPLPLAVFRDENPVFANRTFLDLVGADELPGWVAAGGAASLLGLTPARGGATLIRTLPTGDDVEVRQEDIVWADAPATLLILRSLGENQPDGRAIEHDLAATRARNAELAASLDLAADGTLTLDLSGRILSVSRSAEALFGYAENEIVGEVVTALIVPEDHRELLACLEAVARERHGTARDCEARGRSRRGPSQPFSIRAGIVAGTREPIYLLAFRDLSPSKAIEEELREARSAAERAGTQRADFLAQVSHEIRTPLTAIAGFAELMLDERFGPLDNERYRGYLRDIHASSGHVVSLVNDLLDLAKARSSNSGLEPGELDLSEIVQQCVALAGPLAGREKTILRTAFDPGLRPVWADERSVRQIVLNVLSNAIRFTGAGGQVIVSTTSAGPDDVQLSVRDTGPGMTEGEIEAALTPFRQVAATRRGDGTGLGLPLSKALVEANGGVFSITSGRGRGTLVAIHLPAARTEDSARQTGSTAAAAE